MDNPKGIYVGIDIFGAYCMVSYWSHGHSEPYTASLVAGDDSYAIPLTLAKSFGMSRWYQGRKALDMIRKKEGESVSDLYNLAYEDKSVEIDGQEYSAVELLTIFIRRLLVNPDYIPKDEPIVKLVITISNVDQRNVELFMEISKRIGLPEGRFVLIDHKESFYYYVLSKEPGLYRHEVFLFEYNDNTLYSTKLTRDITSKPQMIHLKNDSFTLDLSNRDREFSRVIEDQFDGIFVSSVFLTGSGFNGDWMEESLEKLTSNRRVFMGNNLYTKGAVYAGLVKDQLKEWPFVYIGDYEMKMNISLKVNKRNEMVFVTLIEAGESWYETKGECEVILEGTPEFECWLQRPDSRKAEIVSLELREFPRRENRTSRLRINANPLSDKSVKITIKDLGFGEIAPSTNKTWEHIIELGD